MSESLEDCIARKMEADPDLSREQAEAQCREASKAGDIQALSFMDKLVKVFEEAMDVKFQALMKTIEERMENIVKQKETEAEQALRRGLGLDKDPVIHLSELEDYVRKILLKETPPGKRTDTPVSDDVVKGTVKQVDEEVIGLPSSKFDEIKKKVGVV